MRNLGGQFLTFKQPGVVVISVTQTMTSTTFTTLSSGQRAKRSLLATLIALLAIAGVVRLFRAAEMDSQDFHVYWKAANLWSQGAFPYQILPEDQGFVFKYPPWMIPLFWPFAWLGYEFSKGIWAVLELLTIFYSFFWLLSQGVRRSICLWVTALFWYLWLAHFYAGQLTLFLLFVALWATNATDFKSSILGVLFTAKVFSAYSLAGVWRQLTRPRVIFYGVLFFLIMNAVLIVKLHAAGLSGLASFESWVELYRGWIRAAGSGGAELGAEVVRGTGNHGLTAAILRWIDPDAKSLKLDLVVSLVLALSLGFSWARSSWRLTTAEKWAGWLAYGVIVHPLAWHHSFVLAYPLCAFSLEAATRTERKSNVGLALLGIALISLLVPQVVGKTWVKPFELLSNKSWGVIVCAWALLRSKKSGAIAA